MQSFTVASVPDTAEQSLQILREANRTGLYSRLGSECPALELYAQLIESGLLDGWITVRGAKVQEVLDARITNAGRDFLRRNEPVYRRSIWQIIPRSLKRFALGVGLMTGFIVFLLVAGRDP